MEELGQFLDWLLVDLMFLYLQLDLKLLDLKLDQFLHLDQLL